MPQSEGDLVLAIKLPQRLVTDLQTGGTAKKRAPLNQGEPGPLLQQLGGQQEALRSGRNLVELSALRAYEGGKVAASSNKAATGTGQLGWVASGAQRARQALEEFELQRAAISRGLKLQAR